MSKTNEKLPEFFPKRIKLKSVFTDAGEPTRLFYGQTDNEVAIEINRLKALYKPSAIEFKITNGGIRHINKYPNGIFFSNLPTDKEFKYKGEGFESYYIANKDYSKVVRLIEI